MSKHRRGLQRPLLLTLTILSVFGLVAASCSSGSDSETATTNADGTPDTSSDGGGDGDDVLNVAIVNNGTMQDIVSLTEEFYTADSGVTVEYTVLEEQALREITTREVTQGGSEFDVVMVGMYEAPQFGSNGSLADLTTFATEDEDYDFDDLIPAVRDGLSNDGKLYASPFYAESSFLMYRQDLVDEAGLEMPAAPTWDEVAAIARELDSDERAGICLRGKAGWGDLGASLTTVINTFGGTWWEANEDGSIGEAKLTSPETTEAVNFYVDLIADAGQDDAATASFNECLGLYQEDSVAMWYDATVAAGILEGDDSPVKGKNGYAQAPVKVTDSSGWLWSWSLAIPEATEDKETAWDYISWATSKEYIETAGENLPGGWAAVPPGTRQSTYDNPNYQEAAAAFADKTLDSMLGADPTNPGTTPRPGLGGVQFVGVPEFQDVGTQCSTEISGVIGGSGSVEDALNSCQEIASAASS